MIEKSKSELIISISIAEDEFVKIGVLQPMLDQQLIEECCQMFGDSYSNLQKLSKFFNITENCYIEHMVLKEGFGFGIHQEGYNAIFHFELNK